MLYEVITDYKFVEEHLINMDDDEDTEVFIFDSKDCLVYHKDTSYFSNGDKRECLMETMVENVEFDSKTNTATYSYDIQKANWTLTSVTRLTQLEQMRRKLFNDILLVTAALILLVILAGNILAKRITRPIIV